MTEFFNCKILVLVFHVVDFKTFVYKKFQRSSLIWFGMLKKMYVQLCGCEPILSDAESVTALDDGHLNVTNYSLKAVAHQGECEGVHAYTG